MSNSELQDDEREALLSIYDGDAAFNQVDASTFQYKYGEHDNPKSFILELKWGEEYPGDRPEINLDVFYNKHISAGLKDKISELVAEEAGQFLGMSMTYSLFECVKEKFDELMALVSEDESEAQIKELTISDTAEDCKKKLPKKEQLTKAQKRRQWNKVGDKGERPRGWDWVDIVKHLSQTGAKDEQMPS